MLSTSQIIGRFIPDFIYCIAGFHHLETRQERIQTLQEWYKILPAGGKVFLTNWALESPLNFEKYKAYKIQGTESHDFLIPF